ncbi:MAG: thioredoxin domain-containing protein [Ignavibacterium sp.]|nr:thioredoxin domain-containing protein [Ignavibacterium sp.]
MKRTREDNTVSVIQKTINHFGIAVTNSSVKEELKSHPNYPSFKSICDSFKEWKVEHYPLKYQPEEMKELTAPYIAHLNIGSGRLAFVSDIKNGLVFYYESLNIKKKTELEEFYKKCSGAVILLNPDENSGERNYLKKRQDELISKSVLPVTIFTLLLFMTTMVINSFSSGEILIQLRPGLLFLTKTIGIGLSLLLILHEYEIRLSLTEKLCHLNKATNCNTVLNDKASKIFGWFGWADVGFIYFTSCLLFLLSDSFTVNYSFLAILSALSLPYPVFSIYYQGLVLKKWCPMCIGVQFILVVEFILLMPVFTNLNLSLSDLSNLLLTFLVTGIVYILIVMYYREKKFSESNYYKYLGFKKNPEVLRSLLLNQKHYDIPVTETSLVFGSRASSIMVTAFLSLQCSHCARALEKIKVILKSDADAAINIILITSDAKILNALYHYSRKCMYDEALLLLETWYGMESYSRSKLSESFCIPEADNISDVVGNENLELYKLFNVTGTPTFFVNGYLLPRQYEIKDIQSFTEVFAGKEETVNCNY